MPRLDNIAAQLDNKSLTAVSAWNPPLSGDMDLRIARNGTWFHQDRVIERTSLVRLFASILRREQNGDYVLVTPIEKWRIQVDDAPFTTGLMQVLGQGKQQRLVFETNLAECVIAGPAHAIVVEYNANHEPAPYIHIRAGLYALISRALFIDLAELALCEAYDDRRVFGVWSEQQFFVLADNEQ